MQWLYSSSRLRFCIYGYFCAEFNLQMQQNSD